MVAAPAQDARKTDTRAGGANNFDALRFLFAASVALFHLAALTAAPALAPLQPVLGQGAELAVQGFFVISGFLVYGSWERTGSVARYFGKRARRLYPAYATIVILMALLSLALFVRDGGGLAHAARYLGANLVFANFLAPALPGMFPDNPSPAVNGALWTIKIEVAFYIAVPVLALLLRRAPKPALIALIYLGAAAWQAGWALHEARTGWPWAAELGRQLPGQMGFFISGVALWIWRHAALRRLPLIAAVSALLFALSFAPGAETLLRPAGWAGLIFCAAFAAPGIYDAGRRGDYSYGLYLVHFPIIQLFVMSGLFLASPLLAVALALAAIAAASWAMWRFVERPFLLPSSHYKAG